MPKRARTFVKATAAAADQLRPHARGSAILLYHRLGGSSGLDIDMPIAVFERQMEILAESGRVATLDQALLALGHDEPSGADPVVLTFDDGTADFCDLALPILERLQLPATLYVATNYVDQAIPFPHDGMPMSWSALIDAHRTGLVTVGSHTHTHTVLDRAAPATIWDELDRSCELIAEHIGEPASHFAYPKALPGSATADAAVRLRFKSAALAGTRLNAYGKTDLWRLARSPIQVSDGMRWFRHKLEGGMALEDLLRRVLNRARYREITT